VDKFTRKSLKAPVKDMAAVHALFVVSKFLLWPLDELAKDPRPKVAVGEEDSLLEYSTDLSPRLIIRAARKIALDLGYYQSLLDIEDVRTEWERSRIPHQFEDLQEPDQQPQAVYHSKLRQAVLWSGLSQADDALDLIQGCPEDSSRTFEREQNLRFQSIASEMGSLLPPPDFLPAHEQVRLVWLVRRCELFEVGSAYKRSWDEEIPSLDNEVELSKRVHEPFKKVASWVTSFDDQMGNIGESCFVSLSCSLNFFV